MTPGFVRVPDAGVPGALASALQSEAGFGPEDLMVMAAITSVGAPRERLPAPHRAMLEMAFAHLGLPPDADDEAIKAAVRAHVSTKPVSPELLHALERFRTDVLPGEQSRATKKNAERMLGRSSAGSAPAPTVPSPRDKGGLTAAQLQSRVHRVIR